jgi:3-hydroxybutyryl-CoA dehydrogenase
MIFFSMTQRSAPYLYQRMKIIVISEKPAPVLFPAGTAACVVVKTINDLEGHRDADLYIDLDFTADETRGSVLSLLLPSPVIVSAVVPTLAEIGHPFIRINGWPGLLEREVHELTVPDTVRAGQIGQLYERLGRSFLLAPDIPGMITPRILATIINEAWYTWEEGVSTKEEIDMAMKLGTNYPMGPFEWGERIGLSRIFHLLTTLGEQDPRYTPAKSLKNAVGALKCD